MMAYVDRTNLLRHHTIVVLNKCRYNNSICICPSLVSNHLGVCDENDMYAKSGNQKCRFFFVRWGYAGHTRLSDAIALLPSSKVASKHCRNMAQRFTLDLSTPENLWASSVGKTSEGLD